MPDADHGAARQRAILVLCALAGAVSFARVANDPALSEEILQSVKAGLLQTTAEDV
jgi:TetR/AcrR family transcriptional repressor of nem operon